VFANHGWPNVEKTATCIILALDGNKQIIANPEIQMMVSISQKDFQSLLPISDVPLSSAQLQVQFWTLCFYHMQNN
jgi:hypothetical protein